MSELCQDCGSRVAVFHDADEEGKEIHLCALCARADEEYDRSVTESEIQEGL